MAAERWDVVVAGGGPAGSTSAYLLARQGFRVAVLDRAHFPRPKACAEYMSPGVGEALRRIGLDRALAGANPRVVPGMDIISPLGSTMRIRYEVDGRPLNASTLPRRIFDAALIEEAVRQGAVLKDGFVAREAVVENGTVRGVRGTRGGKDEEVRGTLTLVADGTRSVIARSLGLAVPPRWPVRLGLVAHYEGDPPLRQGFGQMHVAPGGYCGVAPLPDGLLNVSTVTRSDALQKTGLSATRYFEKWISDHRGLRDLLGDCRPVTTVRGVGPIGARSRRAWAPGALLVGDAAGFFDPFTGEGIYRALVGAELAAEVGGAALRKGEVSAAALRRYGSLRTRAFRSKSGVTALVQLFVQFPPLMDYGLPRLSRRSAPATTLSAVLGDVTDARDFLNVPMLWAALRP